VAAVEARNEFIDRMIPFLHGLALPIAHKYNVSHDELVHVAVVKLCREFYRFKPKMGLSPLTYFGKIAWRVMHDSASRDSVIIPATSWRNKAHTMELGLKAKKAKSLESMTTLEESAEGVMTRALVLDHRETNPELQANTSEIKSLIDAAIATLNRRQQIVVRGRMAGETFASIGVRLGVCRERIRQLEVQAHKILREHLEGRVH